MRIEAKGVMVLISEGILTRDSLTLPYLFTFQLFSLDLIC